MNGEWPFELLYDFVEKRWGTLAAWLVTLALVGAVATVAMWFVFRLA